jgi:hypothetical protein
MNQQTNPNPDIKTHTDAQLQALLRQTVAIPLGSMPSRVHDQALNAWRMQYDVQSKGSVATLARAKDLWQRHAAWSAMLLVLALCLALGWRSMHEASMAELQQLDVLSQLLLEDL